MTIEATNCSADQGSHAATDGLTYQRTHKGICANVKFDAIFVLYLFTKKSKFLLCGKGHKLRDVDWYEIRRRKQLWRVVNKIGWVIWSRICPIGNYCWVERIYNHQVINCGRRGKGIKNNSVVEIAAFSSPNSAANLRCQVGFAAFRDTRIKYPEALFFTIKNGSPHMSLSRLAKCPRGG